MRRAVAGVRYVALRPRSAPDGMHPQCQPGVRAEALAKAGAFHVWTFVLTTKARPWLAGLTKGYLWLTLGANTVGLLRRLYAGAA